MKIAISSRTPDAHQVIRHLLLPWRVTFSGLDESDIVIVYEEKPPENMKTIVVPSDSVDSGEELGSEGLSAVRKPGTETCVAVTPQTALSMVPRTQFCYEGANETASSTNQPLLVKLNDDTFLLTIDIVDEYGRILSESLNPKMSMLHQFLTNLPIPYTVAPKQLRNYFMAWKVQRKSPNLFDKLPLDALRFLLVRAIEETVDEELERRTWNGKRYACAITHDIDTRDGLKRAGIVKKLEEKYDVPSTWYIPTKHYKLDTEAIRRLVNYGEIGAHDTRHDGKLAGLPKQEMIARLHEAKQTLQKIADCPVTGFRAPLLQHNAMIVWALAEAGYTYDTSIPAWEPKHPYVMKSSGIGTTNPIRLGGIAEIPVTLPQDDQMLHVLGMTPRQTVEAWIELKEVVRDIGGICTILTHPSYEMAHPKNLSTYEDLINDLAMDNEAWLTMPAEIANRCLNS